MSKNCREYMKYQIRIANKIFEKALNMEKDKNCKTISSKYSKQVNMSISKYKFEPNNSVGSIKLASLNAVALG